MGGCEAAPVRRRGKTKVHQKMCEQKRAPRPLASSPLTHVNYLRPPQSWRHFALFHSFLCLFILFTRRCGRQLGILAVRRADREGLLRKVSLFYPPRVPAFGSLTRMENTLPVASQLYSDENFKIEIYFNRGGLKRHCALAIVLHHDFQRIDTADRLAVSCVQRCYSAYVGFNRWLFEFLVPFCCLQPGPFKSDL